MLFKGNQSLMAFSNGSYFSYLQFLQSISFELSTQSVSQKSIGKTLSDKSLFINPDLQINVSYLQRNDFANERIFGFNSYSSVQKSILYKYINDEFNKNGFILFKDFQGSSSEDLINQIAYNDFSTDLIGVYFENLYLNSYSFSYSIGSLPVVNASFSAENLKISKLQKDIAYYILSDSGRHKLDVIEVQDLVSETNEGQGRNLVYVLSQIYLENEISTLQAPIPNIDNFLSGNIDSFNLSIDLARNRFLFFEKGPRTHSREFLLPCIGSLEFSGKTSFFTEKSLQDFIKNNKKFSLKIKIGDRNKDAAVFDYTEISLSNITLENFSYDISFNGFLNYSIKCSFEIGEDDGFILNTINIKENFPIGKILLQTSDGYFLRAGDDIFTVKAI